MLCSKIRRTHQVFIRVLGHEHRACRDEENHSIDQTNEYSINSTEYSFKHLTQSRIRSSTWPTQLSNRSGTTFWNIYPIPYLLGFKFFVGSNSCNPNFLTWYINIIRRELGLDFRTDVLINN